MSPVSLVARITRTSMLDVINQDYIRTARAKGVKERSVIFNHALRNAMSVPVLTVVGAQLTMVVGGSFIIESVFFHSRQDYNIKFESLGTVPCR